MSTIASFSPSFYVIFFFVQADKIACWHQILVDQGSSVYKDWHVHSTGILFYWSLAHVPFLEFHFNISANVCTPDISIFLPYETVFTGPTQQRRAIISALVYEMRHSMSCWALSGFKQDIWKKVLLETKQSSKTQQCISEVGIKVWIHSVNENGDWLSRTPLRSCGFVSYRGQWLCSSAVWARTSTFGLEAVCRADPVSPGWLQYNRLIRSSNLARSPFPSS